MTRAARLRRSSDIATLRRDGRSLKRAAFTARLLRTDRLQTRLAVVAPRTVGGAVARNRARRRVREAFRLALTARGSAGGLDVLVTARPEAVHTAFTAIKDDAANVLSLVSS